jgi:hypothetical protein
MSQENRSIDVARAAARMALTISREEEQALRATLATEGIRSAAADYGGDFMTLLRKGVERAVVVAVREGLVADTETEQGVVAGAAHEALSQILPKALGLSVGGKIGLARHGVDVSVSVFLSIGLLHLNEVAIGIGHRAIAGATNE